MTKTIHSFLILASVLVGLTILIWLPYILKISFYGLDFSAGTAVLYRNFDGLEYITIAKSFYSGIPIYFASHFPLYPLLISLFATILGYLKSMILVSLLFTYFAACAFYLLLKDFKLSNQPLWISLLFLVLPARWLIVHSVGSPEPVFIFFLIVSIYGLMKYDMVRKSSWLWLCGLAGLLAQLTRPPGILLFISYIIYIHLRVYKKEISMRDHVKYWPLGIIPLGLLLTFFIFNQSYGDFWAYFHSGDNIHLTFPPFQVFNQNQYWVGDHWLEDIIYIFILGFSGGLILWRKGLKAMGVFILTYFTASTLVAHRDISRYTVLVMPFVLIAFEKFLTSKEFKIVMVILILGIYLYSQNFILHNIAPVANLQSFN